MDATDMAWLTLNLSNENFTIAQVCFITVAEIQAATKVFGCKPRGVSSVRVSETIFTTSLKKKLAGGAR